MNLHLKIASETVTPAPYAETPHNKRRQRTHFQSNDSSNAILFHAEEIWLKSSLWRRMATPTHAVRLASFPEIFWIEEPHGFLTQLFMFADAFHWKKDVVFRLSDGVTLIHHSSYCPCDLWDGCNWTGFILTFKYGELLHPLPIKKKKNLPFPSKCLWWWQKYSFEA